MADMALANRGKRAAWPLQAAGIVNSGAAPATTAAVAVDRGGNASTRRQKLALVTGGAPADPACGPIEIELARELDKGRKPRSLCAAPGARRRALSAAA